MEEKKIAAYRLGFIILIALAALTAFEYWISVGGGTTMSLFIIALIKAQIIVQYFMHVSKLWSEEEHH